MMRAGNPAKMTMASENPAATPSASFLEFTYLLKKRNTHGTQAAPLIRPRCCISEAKKPPNVYTIPVKMDAGRLKSKLRASQNVPKAAKK